MGAIQFSKGKMMEKSEILQKLTEYKKTSQGKYHFERIGIFGSFARGTEGEGSDIDVMIEQKEPDMFVLGNIKCDLEKIFGRKVDVVRIRDGMGAFLMERINRDGIYV